MTPHLTPLIVECPTHGRHHFIYVLDSDWWRCPYEGCETVLAYEDVRRAPDGGFETRVASDFR